ncbi:MAG: RecQ family ATP-dependent DNA helicase [Bacteroidota bacterium]|nr:RecQ family ATP-dependent DNA helicase [Bacteroidota bacterium]
MQQQTRPSLADAREILRKYFGYEDFRPGQDEIIRSVLDGRDTLAVMPTGGGKSICYQIPALLLEGLTIVVSPLISLMHDQVESLLRAGIRATFVNSMLDFRDALERMEKAQRGVYRLIYVAPERFESPAFLERMRGIHVGLFAVDEAHCISEWGHDFRPSYLKLRTAIELFGRPQVVALTATATPDVREDIVRQLGLRQPHIIVRGFNRENLVFRVRTKVSKREEIFAACRSNLTGIVYTGTRNTAEELAALLQSRAIKAEAYHAGLEDIRRKEVQNRFMEGDTRVIVATTAFGMGIDKPDVRFVIHHDMPGTIEQYYQEAGRAGRDGGESICTILYNPGDRALPEFFIRQNYPDRALVKTVYSHLHNVAGTQIGGRFRGLLNLNEQSIAARIGNVGEAAVRGALDVLERSGYIRRYDARYVQASLRFLLDPESMRRWLVDTAPETLAPVAVALLRAVGAEAFHYPVVVSLPEIAEKAFRSEDQILTGVRELHTLRIVDFRSGTTQGGIALLGERVPSRDLAVDFSALEERMRRQQRKLHAVEHYLQSSECRRNVILEYFQEDDVRGVCGKCDNCTHSTVSLSGEDSGDLFDRCAGKILQCIAELDGKFGAHAIVDVLRGSNSRRVSQFKLHEVPSYGSCHEEDRSDLFGVIETMLGMGWIRKTTGPRGTLRVTELGKAKLGRDISPLDLPPLKEAIAGGAKDRLLYETLRAVRRRVAADLILPSHALLPDSVLVNIANALPKTDEELLRVEGVGPITVKRVGKQFLAAIREYLHERELAETASRTGDALKDLSPSLRAILDLCIQGLSIPEIAKRRGLTEGTVSQHVSELIERGILRDIDTLVPPVRQEKIRSACVRCGRSDLKKIKAMLGDEMTYAEIRIVLALDSLEYIVRKRD